MRRCRGTGKRAVSADVRRRRPEGLVHRIALRGAGEVRCGLGNRELAFRAPETLVRFPCVERDPKRPWIGVSDILRGHPDEAARNVQRVASSVQHAADPVERRIRARAPNRLVNGRDEVVEGIAALVEAAKGSAGQRLGDEFAAEAALPGLHREVRRKLQGIEGPAHVSVRRFDEPSPIRRVHREPVLGRDRVRRPRAPVRRPVPPPRPRADSARRPGPARSARSSPRTTGSPWSRR